MQVSTVTPHRREIERHTTLLVTLTLALFLTSTNHLEPGEHIGGKANTLKHRPIDFVVPLMHESALLRQLWRGAAGELRAPDHAAARAMLPSLAPGEPPNPYR